MTPYRLRLLLCLLFFAAATSSALAQEEEEEKKLAQVIQEFPFSEPVYLQEKHEIQSTVSYYHAGDTAPILNSLGYEAEYGITDWLQVSAEVAQHHRHRQHSNSNLYQLEAGTMLSLLNTTRQAASFLLEVEFPLRKPKPEGEETDGANVSYTPMLIYACQLGNVQLQLNGAAELEAGEKEWMYNAVAVYGSGHWHPLLEVNGTYQENEADWYLAPGLVVNGGRGWEFIAGIRRSLPHHNWGLSAKLVYEFTAGKH